MSEKTKIVEALMKRGIDPIKLEKELLAMMRREQSPVKMRDYLRKLLEGEKR